MECLQAFFQSPTGFIVRFTGVTLKTAIFQLVETQHGGHYRDDVRELNSIKSPTARNILLSDVSREVMASLELEGVVDGFIDMNIKYSVRKCSRIKFYMVKVHELCTYIRYRRSEATSYRHDHICL
jgi:hypothetical protein